jgi:CubicO group peptidase (beta-lactamase class C family)
MRVATAVGAMFVVGAMCAVAACSSDASDAETEAQTIATASVEQAAEPVATAPDTTESPVTTPAVTDTVDDGVTTTAPAGTSTTTVPLPSYDFSSISPVVQSFIDAEGLNGAGLIVVDRDHGVIHEDYWGEFDADRISLVASSSKMITAGVLLHLADQGLLDMDAPVAEVAEWGAGNPTITPAQLVSNSSGLVGLLPDPGYRPYVCQFIAGGTIQECAAQAFTTPDDDGDIVPPDTEYRYGGAQWQVAGAVAEVASGKSWAELIDEIYVEPCGLDTLGYNNHFAQRQVGANGFAYPTNFGADPTTLLPTDNPNMEGGAYITTGDYGKLLLMHLRDGRCGDTQVLSTAALDRSHSDRTGEVYGSPTGYGMGWWVDRDSGRLTDPGAYGAVPWLDLEDGYGAYLVVEADTVTGVRLAAELYDLVDTAVTTPT